MDIKEALENACKAYSDFEEACEEARNAGYKNGYQDGCNDKQHDLEYDYAKGLEDAWECARSIINHEVPYEFWDLASGQSTFEVFKHYSAKGAIEKVKEYKEYKAKQTEIKFGDILENLVNGYKYIALRVDEDGYVNCIDQYGRASTQHKGNFKIIEHNPQMENTFEKIRED